MILLEVREWHWTLQALDFIQLGHAANTLRGALGYALATTPEYAEWFRPEAPAGTGPSGLSDPPRPFVLRAVHLDGALLQPGARFGFAIHSFETRDDRFHLIRNALMSAALAGIGETRGRAQLVDAAQREPVRIGLDPPAESVRRLHVHYLTPTELKGGDLTDFATLFSRARDRVATLRSLYGAGPLDVDFKGLGERARAVRTTASDLVRHDERRTSTRTRQTHGLGGQTGVVEFEGDLTEFLPWLQAAQWTGVGRQTVWGKGAIEII